MGGCVCRPGLTLLNGQCVDTKSNPQFCGQPGQATTQCTGNTPLCDNGVCVGQCGNNKDNCNGQCINTDIDPLHCGSCGGGGGGGSICQSDEVCVNGECRSWIPGLGCNTCPCQSSCFGNHDQCCPYPGAPTLIACVDANSCPQ